MRRTATSILWVAALLGIVACRGCILPDRNLERRVAQHEVVGTWEMTSETLALLERDGTTFEEGVTFTIKLDEDGSAEFASARDGFDGVAYERLSGTWTLEHDTTRGDTTKKANTLRIELVWPDAESRAVDHWYLVEVNGRLRLWQWYGDPDSWEFLEYVRE
jgi:hypothetical protein